MSAVSQDKLDKVTKIAQLIVQYPNQDFIGFRKYLNKTALGIGILYVIHSIDESYTIHFTEKQFVKLEGFGHLDEGYTVVGKETKSEPFSVFMAKHLEYIDEMYKYAEEAELQIKQHIRLSNIDKFKAEIAKENDAQTRDNDTREEDSTN